MPDLHDAPAHEAVSIPCIACGYDLRGLDADGPCPECGTPIERSRRGDLLAYADPQWLARIARGQKWVARGMLVIVLAIVGFMAAFLLVMTAALIPWGEVVAVAFDRTVSLILPLGLQVGLVTATIGAFLVTARDPRDTLREKPASARNVAREAMLACIVLIALRYALALTPLGGRDSISIAMALAIAASVSIAVLSLLTCLRALAVRTGDTDLPERTENRCRRLRWFLPVFFAVVIVNRIMGAAVMGTTGMMPGLISVALSIVAFVLAIAMLVELDTFTRLMFGYRRAFDRCAAAANELDSA